MFKNNVLMDPYVNVASVFPEITRSRLNVHPTPLHYISGLLLAV